MKFELPKFDGFTFHGYRVPIENEYVLRFCQEVDGIDCYLAQTPQFTSSPIHFVYKKVEFRKFEMEDIGTHIDIKTDDGKIKKVFVHSVMRDAGECLYAHVNYAGKHKTETIYISDFEIVKS